MDKVIEFSVESSSKPNLCYILHLQNYYNSNNNKIAISNSIVNSIAGPIINTEQIKTSNSLPNTSIPPPNLLVEVSMPHSSPSSNPDLSINQLSQIAPSSTLTSFFLFHHHKL
ncbi:unnamed protein product [Meloidogyne enterolobii]|uniref:Uncharacterized protein n=1 Tax=Meloidogyne enterolobii TaxID=390850 RepID=A0ACB0ZVD4_MELEN